MDDTSTRTAPVIILPALFRSVAPVAIVWGAIVGLGFYSRQPGVVCVTPMAWLLAIWTGVQYVKGGSQTRARLSLTGPAIAGLVLGIVMAVVWLLGSNALTPPAAPASELEKA